MNYEANRFPTIAVHCPGNDFIPIRTGMFSAPDETGGIELFGSICCSCGLRAFPARESCAGCFKTVLETCSLGREGVVRSHTVVHQAPRGYLGPVPFILGMVEMTDSGVTLMAHLVARPAGQWRLGDAVSACAIVLKQGSLEREIAAYAFRPRDAATPAGLCAPDGVMAEVPGESRG